MPRSERNRTDQWRKLWEKRGVLLPVQGPEHPSKPPKPPKPPKPKPKPPKSVARPSVAKKKESLGPVSSAAAKKKV